MSVKYKKWWYAVQDGVQGLRWAEAAIRRLMPTGYPHDTSYYELQLLLKGVIKRAETLEELAATLKQEISEEINRRLREKNEGKAN